MKVPSSDFINEYKSIKKDIDSSISRVLKSGWFILGNEVKQFELEFASFIGAKHCIGVASGTDALTVSVESLGLTEKDEVIVPDNVYPTIFGIARSKAKVRLADVDPETLNISPDSFEKAITKNTRAVVVVHLYGNPANVEQICKIAKKHNVFVIEDCAQAVGAEYKGVKVGTFGDIACFSFYPTKNLGAYGDAGAIITNNQKLFEKASILRMYGEKDRYKSVTLGINSRLDEMQAAILRAKLPYLLKWNKRREEISNTYRVSLDGLPLSFIKQYPVANSCNHLFVIKVDKRDKLLSYLKSKEIAASIHYPIPIHLTDSLKYLKYKKGDFPVSENACNQVLSLPINPQISEKQVTYICKEIKNFLK